MERSALASSSRVPASGRPTEASLSSGTWKEARWGSAPTTPSGGRPWRPSGAFEDGRQPAAAATTATRTENGEWSRCAVGTVRGRRGATSECDTAGALALGLALWLVALL